MKKRIMLDLGHKEETARVARALSAPLRLDILELLMKRSCNVTEIAETFGQAVSSIANHIRVLEGAGLITTTERPGVRGSQKVSGIAFESVHFSTTVPTVDTSEHTQVYEVGIGRYFDCQVQGPCGLISEKSYIGTEDQPAVFYESDRVYAQLLWFQTGYVEYRFPYKFAADTEIRRLVFSMELCSEAPGFNHHWPSDITVSVNGSECALLHSAGDYGGVAGGLNPSWWPLSRTQYGMLRQVEINVHGCFADGERCSDLSLRDIATENPFISLRLEVKEDAVHRGGLNLFGERFGNHPQSIKLEIDTYPNPQGERHAQ